MARRRKQPADYDGKIPLEDPKQDLFCSIYTTNTLPNFWGNGQNSYEFAYGHSERIRALDELIADPKKRKKQTLKSLEKQIKNIKHVCAVSAAQLLIRPDIKKRCDFLLDSLAAHNIVDRELLYVIQQRKNLEAKVSAIQHHDKREARIREKIDMDVHFDPIKAIRILSPAKK